MKRIYIVIVFALLFVIPATKAEDPCIYNCYEDLDYCIDVSYLVYEGCNMKWSSNHENWWAEDIGYSMCHDYCLY